MATFYGRRLRTKTGSASATFSVIEGETGRELKVYSISLMTSSTSAVTITFKDGEGGTAVGTYILQAISGTNFGITENTAAPTYLFKSTSGNPLEMSFSAAVSVTYNVRYWADDKAD